MPAFAPNTSPLRGSASLEIKGLELGLLVIDAVESGGTDFVAAIIKSVACVTTSVSD